MIGSIWLWAVSRIVSMGICAVSSFFIPHHDLSYALLNDKSRLMFLVRWDSIFFYCISRDGYKSDSMTAFFPLYPMAIRLLVYCGIPTVVSGVIISNLSFLVSSMLLYRITEKYFDKNIAHRACFLFCFSPCSILYSSLYTESMFTMFVMLFIDSVLSQDAWAVVWISLASAVRSNGFILAPVLFFGLFRKYGLFVCSMLCLFPLGVFAGIQAYWWINRFPHVFMLPYSYVQSKYWEQGFLRFYQHPKNIPNLLVGAPFVSLSVCILWNYFSREKRTLKGLYINSKAAARSTLYNRAYPLMHLLSILNWKKPVSCARKDTLLRNNDKKIRNMSVIRTDPTEETKIRSKLFSSRYILSDPMRYYMIRLFLQCVLLFQVVLSIFFIHMNMHFRFIAYNPVVYWELSEMFERKGLGRLAMFGYVCFSFAYSVLYGAYFPPA